MRKEVVADSAHSAGIRPPNLLGTLSPILFLRANSACLCRDHSTHHSAFRQETVLTVSSVVNVVSNRTRYRRRAAETSSWITIIIISIIIDAFIVSPSSERPLYPVDQPQVPQKTDARVGHVRPGHRYGGHPDPRKNAISAREKVLEGDVGRRGKRLRSVLQLRAVRAVTVET